MRKASYHVDNMFTNYNDFNDTTRCRSQKFVDGLRILNDVVRNAMDHQEVNYYTTVGLIVSLLMRVTKKTCFRKYMHFLFPTSWEFLIEIKANQFIDALVKTGLTVLLLWNIHYFIVFPGKSLSILVISLYIMSFLWLFPNRTKSGQNFQNILMYACDVQVNGQISFNHFESFAIIKLCSSS